MTVVLDDHGEMEVQQSGACAVYPPDEGLDGYAVGCDIGTTTVVCHLLNCATGQRIGTVGGANAQKVFGADVNRPHPGLRDGQAGTDDPGHRGSDLRHDLHPLPEGGGSPD